MYILLLKILNYTQFIFSHTVKILKLWWSEQLFKKSCKVNQIFSGQAEALLVKSPI